METIKTAVVVTCLLGVLYGVYTILNKPDSAPPPEVATAFENGGDVPELDIDFDASDFADGGDFPSADAGFGGDTGYAAPDTQYPAPDAAMTSEPYATEPAQPSLSPVEPYDPSATDAAIQAYQPNNSLPGDTSPEASLAANGGVGATANPADALNLNAPGDLGEPMDATPAPPPAPTDPQLPTLDPVQPMVDPPIGAPTANYPIVETPGIAPPPVAIEPPVTNQYNDPGLSGDIAVAPPLSDTPGIPNLPPAGPAVTVEPEPATTDEAPLRPFERARRSALAQIEAKQLRQALFTLSLFYNDPELTAAEHQQLLDLLDPLAGSVIYSRDHLLTSAHVTTQGEDLNAIAAKYQVPAKLLANINGVTRPDAMTSGMELKVVPGPFRAEVDLTKGEMTLFVQRLYAGRFPISVGNDPTPREGEYAVKEKQPGQTYYTASGGTIAANDPTNPYGSHWIDLGGISVHGTSQRATNVSQGCISLSPRDAADVYNILATGSKITVRR